MTLPIDWPKTSFGSINTSLNTSQILTATQNIAAYSDSLITPTGTPYSHTSASSPITTPTVDYTKTAQFTNFAPLGDVPSSHAPAAMTNTNDYLFWRNNSGELYQYKKSTNEVHRIVPDSAFSFPYSVVALNEKIYCIGTVNTKTKLLEFDVVSQNTRQISNLNNGADDFPTVETNSVLHVFNNKIYCVGKNSSGFSKIFVFDPLDGANGSIKQISDMASGASDAMLFPVNYNNKMYFWGDNKDKKKLCVYDPSDNSIKRLTNFRNNNEDAYDTRLAVHQGKIYFCSYTPSTNNSKLFALDPSNGTIKQASNIQNGSYDAPTFPVSCEDGLLYFGSYDLGLCCLDLSANGGAGLITTNLINISSGVDTVRIISPSYRKKIFISAWINNTDRDRIFMYSSADGGSLIKNTPRTTSGAGTQLYYVNSVLFNNWIMFPSEDTGAKTRFFAYDTGIALPTSGEGAPVVTASGVVVGEVAVDPTQNEVTLNGEPLPTGSILRNTTDGQKFLKTEGGTTSYDAIPITPEPSWNLGVGSDSAWAILQEK